MLGNPASDVDPSKLDHWHFYANSSKGPGVFFRHHDNAFAHLGSSLVGARAVVVGFPFRAVWIDTSLGMRHSKGVAVIEAIPLTLNMLMWSIVTVTVYTIVAALLRRSWQIGCVGQREKPAGKD